MTRILNIYIDSDDVIFLLITQYKKCTHMNTERGDDSGWQI